MCHETVREPHRGPVPLIHPTRLTPERFLSTEHLPSVPSPSVIYCLSTTYCLSITHCLPPLRPILTRQLVPPATNYHVGRSSLDCCSSHRSSSSPVRPFSALISPVSPRKCGLSVWNGPKYLISSHPRFLVVQLDAYDASKYGDNTLIAVLRAYHAVRTKHST